MAATPTRTTATPPEMVDRRSARTGWRPSASPDRRPGTARTFGRRAGTPRTSRPLRSTLGHRGRRSRAASTRSTPRRSSPSTGSSARCVVPRDEPGRFDDLLSEADVERLVCSTAIRYPGFRLVPRGEPARRRRLRERRLLAAAVHGHGRRPARRRRVGGGRHDRPAGAARQLAPARRLLPPARGRARTRRAGELVLHAERLTGIRRPPRHARRARASRWRARSAGCSTTRCSSYRSSTSGTRAPSAAHGPADRRLRAEGGRHAVPPAWLAPRGGDVADRLAAPDDRDRGPHVARRRARRARRRCEDEPGFRRDVEHGEADGLAAALAAQLDPELGRAAPAPAGSSSRAGRSARTASPSSARSSGLDAGTLLERRETVIADLEEATGAVSARLRGQGDRLPRARRARAAGVLREPRSRSGVADLPGELDADGPPRPRAPPRPRGLSPRRRPLGRQTGAGGAVRGHAEAARVAAARRTRT